MNSWRKLLDRLFAAAGVGATVFALTVAALAETASPHAFVDGIYKTYLSKDSKGVPLSNDGVVRRYFAPPLADAIIKDFAAAHKAGEVPLLNGDPFIDAQDWDVSDIKIAVKTTGPDRALATVTFRIFKEARTVTLDLVNATDGWRIAEIRGPSGSLRALYKLK